MAFIPPERSGLDRKAGLGRTELALPVEGPPDTIPPDCRGRFQGFVGRTG